MSFIDLENALNKFKNIEEAPDLRKKVQELLNELERKEELHQAVLAQKDRERRNLKQELVESNTKYNELVKIRVIYNKDEYSLKQINTLVNNRFTDKVEKKINELVQDKFKKSLPILLKTEISTYPVNCSRVTRHTIKSAAINERNTLLRQKSTWPEWFKQIVDEDAQKIAYSYYNKEFWRQVNIKKNEEVEYAKNELWPTYLHEIFSPFLQQEFRKQLQDLNTELLITCGSCGGEYEVTLGREDIVQLIRSGFTVVNCPFSHGLFRHRYRLKFAEVLLAITTESID